MKLANDLTGWATMIVDRVGILYIIGTTFVTGREKQLVVMGNALQKIPCPFEA